ncbi:hypothetical protein WG68_03185 [Arsukibacterium ikkense]|uniref:YjbF family lipoprotein n=1 Tax=Arsukibacterium ikkense TaxID=336831 RepID=A0A0M2VCV7_9GAMM|nr:YjbF family lipoprotein [Arsukibacterium ikkense]KKO46953.1 hypothetical protein WG68_03185 [Arsukibacterium ikkense]
MNLNVIRNLALLIMLGALVGCAGTYRAYVDMLSYAFTPPTDASLSLAQVNASATDLLYLRHGDRPQAVLALAFIEQQQHKWISADGVLLVLEQGRLVRTSGLSNDLLYLTNRAADPLKRLPDELFRASWLRLADWSKGEYGYQINSEFKAAGLQDLAFFDQSIKTLVFEERVEYPNQANFIGVNKSFNNTYWFDSATGLLVQSRQQLSPQTDPIEMTYISRIGRLLQAHSL